MEAVGKGGSNPPKGGEKGEKEKSEGSLCDRGLAGTV